MRSKFYVKEKLGPKQSLTPEGFLLCEEVPIARTGVMIYGPNETPIAAGPDGIVKIVREPEDVFTDETIASAQGKPVTNDHPEDDVTPENWKQLCVGTMLNVRRGTAASDDLLFGDLLITTPEGIEAVRSGKTEVSLGYEADYEELAEGVGKQKNIVVNHIALVDQGRCGPRCAISDRKPNLEGEKVNSKLTKIKDALNRAFKAKDADEVEKIADELTEHGEGETHIHIHNGPVSGEPANKVTADNEELTEKKVMDDEGVQEFVAQNAKEHAEMLARIEALEAKLKGTADDGELPDEALDELPEEVREQAAKAKDSSYFADSFHDVVSKAEVLVPGIRIPTYDRAAKPADTYKAVCKLRRQAMDLAYVMPDTRAIMDDILAGKKFDSKGMTCDAIRSLFNTAYASKRAANNASQKGGVSRVADVSKVQKGPMTLAELNQHHAKLWG